MIISTDPRDMLDPSVVEVRVRGNEYHGLQLTDWTSGTPASLNARLARIGALQGVELNAADVTVPAQFSGLTVENVGIGDGLSPHPIDLGMNATHWHRVLPQGGANDGCYWAQIEQAAGVYSTTKLRAALQAAKDRGCKTLWTTAYCPTIYASNQNVKRSSGFGTTRGWPSAPTDLTATMQADPRDNSPVTRAFVTAVITELGHLIDAIEFGNEINYRMASTASQAQAPCGNFFDTSDTWGGADYTTPRSSVTGDVQRYAQWVRWQACFYATVKALRPAILVLAPSFYGEVSSQSVGGKQDGQTCFVQWLADGGAAYCDGYSWHSYSDLYQKIDLGGVSYRLTKQLKALEAARVAAGAPAKTWYCTEVGHEGLGYLPAGDQVLWADRLHGIHGALGFGFNIAYAWDSINTSTDHMSWYLRSANPGKGLAAGLQPIAARWNSSGAWWAGKTISAGAVQLNDGRLCGRINGVPYVV